MSRKKNPRRAAHPGAAYWSATISTAAFFTNNPAAWSIDFRFGNVSPLALATGLNNGPQKVWCVRGGQGVDSQ
jgi:hypothetical protein